MQKLSKAYDFNSSFNWRFSMPNVAGNGEIWGTKFFVN